MTLVEEMKETLCINTESLTHDGLGLATQEPEEWESLYTWDDHLSDYQIRRRLKDGAA